MNKIQKSILVQLMHQPGMKFNQLWGKQMASAKFAYHMKILEEEGFIEKKDETYKLTMRGRKEVAFFDGKTGKKTTTPISGVMVFLIHDGKLLMQKRAKEPHFGYWGIPSGKIEYSQTVFEASAAELMEETGLQADFSLRGMMCARTFEANEQTYNHHLFVIAAKNPRGTLVKQTREGKNEWMSFEDIKHLDTYPDIPKLVEIARQDGFTFFETDRFAEDGRFVDWKVTEEIDF